METSEAVAVITGQDVLVPGRVVFTGRVRHSTGSISWIAGVRRGYETINTNGDVFCPESLRIGAWVEFDELNQNPDRPGAFRTEHAREMESSRAPQLRIQALERLARRQTYHLLTAKHVDPQQAAQAAENMPFANLIGLHQKPADAEQAVAAAEEILKTAFASLAPHGVSFSVTAEPDLRQEMSIIENEKKALKEARLGSQSDDLMRTYYEEFSSVRRMFRMMHREGILTTHNIIPVHYLPDLLVAAPVWYYDDTHFDPFLENPDRADEFIGQDRSPIIPLVGEWAGSREFAWLFQMYNARRRPLSSCSGRDIVPPRLREIIQAARSVFDYIAICTPYHDVVSSEWANGVWIRNIDPFVIGLKKGLPFMFLLGRYSCTGLFPLLPDMVADTIDHLRMNKGTLGRIPKNMTWYHGLRSYETPYNPRSCRLEDGASGDNTVLEPFAGEVIAAFGAGNLFRFLRGELSKADTPGKTKVNQFGELVE
ncbi:MAG TPA: hypothetical protein VJC16_05035 [Candidatus Nanoarchaeia archaeon]|nr:hypothetical protein [Candidatus Nanoarchaeia archaeon]